MMSKAIFNKYKAIVRKDNLDIPQAQFDLIFESGIMALAYAMKEFSLRDINLAITDIALVSQGEG